MNLVVKKNLERMTGEKTEDMGPVLTRESMGGNAGSWRGFQCQAANFYYSKWTGEIICFGNIQNIPETISKNNPSGAFRLALNLKIFKSRIVELIISENASDEAKKNLAESMNEYNKLYGFEIRGQ